MNTHVNFETAQMLFKQGYESKSGLGYDKLGNIGVPYFGNHKTNGICNGDLICEAPTIAEVVMWLYKKHWIWITVRREFVGSDEWEFSYIISYLPKEFIKAKKRSIHFKTIESFKENIGSYQGAWFLPKEAYEAAIEYTLKHLI